ncbi:MAG: response regulator [Acidimicrobiales bacterium]
MPDLLVATDSEAVFQELRSVLDAPGTRIRWARAGADVAPALDAAPADLAILDMQIGAMGGVAVALDLRLEADAGRLERCPVLLVLDRRPDVFLARRIGVEGWLVKPLDPIRIRRAATALLAGGTWHDTSWMPEPATVRPHPAPAPDQPTPASDQAVDAQVAAAAAGA